MIDLDQYAAQASQRYVDFLNALRNILWSAMRQDPTDMRSRDMLRSNALDRARTFRDQETFMLGGVLSDVAQNAQESVLRDLGVTTPRNTENAFLTAYKDDLAVFMDTELTSQIQRDIAQLQRFYEEFGLEVFMERQSAPSAEEAHVRVLINAKDSIQFFFRERGGRRLNSQKFVRVVTRHTMVTAWTQIYAMEAASFGASYMTIEHPDSSKYEGQKIGVRQDQGLPLLADIKDDVFHPQSKAYLKAHF